MGKEKKVYLQIIAFLWDFAALEYAGPYGIYILL